MVMLKRTIGFESTSQETLTVCFIAALIIVDSEEHTGGSLIEIDREENALKLYAFIAEALHIHFNIVSGKIVLYTVLSEFT